MVRKEMRPDDMVVMGGELREAIMSSDLWDETQCEEGASHAQWWRTQEGSMCPWQEEPGMFEEKERHCWA